MLTYVLDASAYLRFVLREAGHDRVSEILQAQRFGSARAIMSAVQWGEIVKVVTIKGGPHTPAALARYLSQIGFQIIGASAERAERSAMLGLKYRISYADAFGVELASDSPEHVLVTADYGVKPAEHDVRIEFLPVKARP